MYMSPRSIVLLEKHNFHPHLSWVVLRQKILGLKILKNFKPEGIQHKNTYIRFLKVHIRLP